MREPQAIISGGGIGGLAAALAITRAGWGVQLLEKADVFSEVGAGVQLGPNVVKLLQAWGQGSVLKAVAAFPEELQVRSAISGEQLGRLRLGSSMSARYGACYATIHRADLHGLLLDAIGQTSTNLHLACPLLGFADHVDGVTVQTACRGDLEADVLVGADGLWSVVRQQLLGDGPPRASGHLAYRALVPQASLPEKHRSRDVTVWLGPRMHVVHYPVRRGELLNIVAVVHGDIAADEIASWDHSANGADLDAALQGAHASLRDLVRAVAHWRLWPLRDRPPLQAANQQARGRIALLGDAAHPMRPYLAQGAGMAIEDAFELGRQMQLKIHAANTGSSAFDVPLALQRYASQRWQRNARVQARAQRNGEVFHADGLMRLARDASIKLMGEKLLDMPWLYGAGPGV